MIMSWIWSLMLAGAFLAAASDGSLALFTSALFEGAQSALTLCLSLAGVLCLWSGLIRLMDASGLSQALCRLFQPLLRRLFPDAWRDSETAACLSGNFVANLLGLGNAATPLGVKAVQRMAQGSKAGTASNEMCRLIVLNTASIQLLPTTVCAIRSTLGAAAPLDLLYHQRLFWRR